MKSLMKYIIPLLAVLFLLTACTQNIEEIKNEEHVGEKVTVRGTATNTIKIGKLSGFTLTDSNDDTISVSTETLPTEETTVRVSGVLMKDTIFGYYIKADRVS